MTSQSNSKECLTSKVRTQEQSAQKQTLKEQTSRGQESQEQALSTPPPTPAQLMYRQR